MKYQSINKISIGPLVVSNSILFTLQDLTPLTIAVLSHRFLARNTGVACATKIFDPAVSLPMMNERWAKPV